MVCDLLDTIISKEYERVIPCNSLSFHADINILIVVLSWLDCTRNSQRRRQQSLAIHICLFYLSSRGFGLCHPVCVPVSRFLAFKFKCRQRDKSNANSFDCKNKFLDKCSQFNMPKCYLFQLFSYSLWSRNFCLLLISIPFEEYGSYFGLCWIVYSDIVFVLRDECVPEEVKIFTTRDTRLGLDSYYDYMFLMIIWFPLLYKNVKNWDHKLFRQRWWRFCLFLKLT